MKAGKIAVKLIEKYFSEKISFNQETTLCGKSIIRNIQRAKELGYTIELHYVGVDSVDIAKERVKKRVSKGGMVFQKRILKKDMKDLLII